MKTEDQIMVLLKETDKMINIQKKGKRQYQLI